MPMYFFHLTDGKDVLTDDEGVHLSDAKEARREARAAVRELAKPVSGASADRWHGWFIRVVEETGSEVAQVAAGHAWPGGGNMSAQARELAQEIAQCREWTLALIDRNRGLRQALANELQESVQRKKQARAVLARAAAQRAGRRAVPLLVSGGGASARHGHGRPRLSIIMGDKRAG